MGIEISRAYVRNHVTCAVRCHINTKTRDKTNDTGTARAYSPAGVCVVKGPRSVCERGRVKAGRHEALNAHVLINQVRKLRKAGGREPAH